MPNTNIRELSVSDLDLEKVAGGSNVVLQHEKVTGASTSSGPTTTFTYGGLSIPYSAQ